MRSSTVLRVSLVLLLGLVAARPAEAQVRAGRPSVRVDTRYDRVEGGALADRLQAGLRIEETVAVGEAFDVVLFVATGDDFTSSWATVYSFRDGRSRLGEGRPRLRRLYVQRTRPGYRLQLGAVPPVKAVVSPTGLDPAGWVDGARAELYLARDGTLEFVLGRLGSIETPSVFARPLLLARPGRLNYAEIELSQPVASWLRLEASAEYLRAPYVRGEVRWMPGPAEVFTELLYNLADAAVVVGTTVEGDVLAPFGTPDRLQATLRHAYKDAEIGLRGELADEFVTFGHSLTAIAEVLLSKRHGLRGEVEAIVAEGVGVEGRRGDRYTRLKVVLGWRWP